MKIRSYILAAGLLASGLAFTGCSSVLEETDRQGYTPEYFKTEKVYRQVSHHSMPTFAIIGAMVIGS